MISHNELKKGGFFILEKQPHQVLETKFNFRGRGKSLLTAKIKNLLTGAVLNKTFHSDDRFQEADLEQQELKFLYQHRGQFFFCFIDNPSQRFFLPENRLETIKQFLKPNLIVKGLFFKNEIINIEIPIKIILKVSEAPPGASKTDRATAGTKQVTLETGAKINTPPFIQTGDIIEVNTETGQYVRRIE